MERLLRGAGLPGYGQLVWYWSATWVLGFLLYNWQLGLQLLPIAAASLALSAVAAMQPLAAGSSAGSNGGSGQQGASGRRSIGLAGANRGSRQAHSSSMPAPSSSSSDGGWSLPVWPSQAAGGLLAADCLVLALLCCLNQQAGLASGPLLALLATTPRLLAVVLLLLWGQVMVDVLFQGWWGHEQLRHASLLCRCWLIAAVGVCSFSASGSGSLLSILAAAAAWVQKAHMLLVEGPVCVLYLGALLQPLVSYQQQQPTRTLQTQQQQGSGPAAAGSSRGPTGSCSSSSSRVAGASGGAASSSATRIPATPEAAAAATAQQPGMPSSSGDVSALLYCLHFLLQLLVVLFVPPGPLAAAAWLPQPVQGLLVWGARVLLCGIGLQLVLRAMNGTQVPHTAAAAARGSILAAGSMLAAAGAPAALTASPDWSSGVRNFAGRDTSCAGNRHAGGSSSCGAGLTCAQQQYGAAGVSCCSSPSPRGRKGWELQVHGHNSGSSSCAGSPLRSFGVGDAGQCGASHPLCGMWDASCADVSCGGGGSGGDSSSWALARNTRNDHYQLSGYGAATGMPGMMGSSSLGGGNTGSSATAVAIHSLLWQHAPFLLLLSAAFAGDTFITAAAAAAAPSILAAGGAEGAAAVTAAGAVRVAWQRCLECCLVAGLCLEVVAVLRRELLLLRLPLLSRRNGSSSSPMYTG
jgi:hypothetical protein